MMRHNCGSWLYKRKLETWTEYHLLEIFPTIIMASTIFFVLALAASAVARPTNVSSVTTEQGEPNGNIDPNSPLILDDMRFVDGQLDQVKTAFVPTTKMRWTNKMVPYVIDASLVKYTDFILQAMNEYHTKTCIRFVPRTTQANYIVIFEGKGCYSNVGMIGGEQLVSLGQGCMFKGTILHELGHALGCFHELNRSDRDDYLRIQWQNIEPGMKTQLFMLKDHENIRSEMFDYDSIMMYGNFAFSKNGKWTMAAKNGVRLMQPYEKDALSKQDVTGINSLYFC